MSNGYKKTMGKPMTRVLTAKAARKVGGTTSESLSASRATGGQMGGYGNSQICGTSMRNPKVAPGFHKAK